MLISEAYAQAASGAVPAADPMQGIFGQLLLFAPLILVFYFLIFRPQQRARTAHQQMLTAIKRGDIVVTGGGLIGKVKSVADDEVRIELSPNVEVRAVRATISEIRSKSEPAPANDTKASAD